MASCTFVAQNSAHNGAWVNSTSWNYAGATSEYYYTALITFKTPSFSGESQSVLFNLAVAQQVGTSVSLRYAICSSDANKSSYCNTYNTVTDSNQITSGTVTISGVGTTVSYKTIDIDTTGLKGNTTYYLFLWASKSKSSPQSLVIQPQGEYISDGVYVNHTVSIYYGSANYIYIDNGTSWDKYQVYIDNGAGWDLYTAYIDNGSSWDACG